MLQRYNRGGIRTKIFVLTILNGMLTIANRSESVAGGILIQVPIDGRGGLCRPLPPPLVFVLGHHLNGLIP